MKKKLSIIAALIVVIASAGITGGQDLINELLFGGGDSGYVTDYEDGQDADGQNGENIDADGAKNSAGDARNEQNSTGGDIDKGRGASSEAQSGQSIDGSSGGGSDGSDGSSWVPDKNGWYNSKDEVAAYINTYGELPQNYLTKEEAGDYGWDSSQGNLDEIAPGMSIGGDRFGNREGILPKASGRTYYECDIDYNGGFRNAKRIVYSNDGLIYYTDDHYETFELLYGEE